MLSSKVLSVVTSIINAGEFVGACSSFYLGDKLGLKKGLYISTFFIAIGVVLQVAGHNEASLICGRLFLGRTTSFDISRNGQLMSLGYAVGLISCFVPLYVAECAPASIRGASVTAYQFLIGIGLILGLVVDYATSKRTDTGSYRIPMAVQLMFPIVFCSGLLTIAPESPRWLFRHKGPEASAAAFRQLNGKRTTEEIQAELNMMDAAIEMEIADSRRSSWKQVFSWGPEGRKAWLGFSIQGMLLAIFLCWCP
jgi:SP family sugar:H+ symporter-like MFS transporter